MKKFLKDDPQALDQRQRNKSLRSHVRERLSNIRRKMSRGAANIVRMMGPGRGWRNWRNKKYKDK